MNVLHHDLKSIKATGLGDLDFITEALDEVLIDNAVRGGKESENMRNKVTLIIVHTVVPIVEIL